MLIVDRECIKFSERYLWKLLYVVQGTIVLYSMYYGMSLLLFSGFITLQWSDEMYEIMCLALLYTVKLIRSINLIVGLKFVMWHLALDDTRSGFGFSHPLLVTLLPLLIKCRLFDVCCFTCKYMHNELEIVRPWSVSNLPVILHSNSPLLFTVICLVQYMHHHHAYVKIKCLSAIWLLVFTLVHVCIYISW